MARPILVAPDPPDTSLAVGGVVPSDEQVVAPDEEA